MIAVAGLMIKVETHAGTISLLFTNAPSEFGSYLLDCMCYTRHAFPFTAFVPFVDDISAIRAVQSPEPPLTMTRDVLSVWNA